MFCWYINQYLPIDCLRTYSINTVNFCILSLVESVSLVNTSIFTTWHYCGWTALNWLINSLQPSPSGSLLACPVFTAPATTLIDTASSLTWQLHAAWTTQSHPCHIIFQCFKTIPLRKTLVRMIFNIHPEDLLKQTVHPQDQISARRWPLNSRSRKRFRD